MSAGRPLRQRPARMAAEHHIAHPSAATISLCGHSRTSREPDGIEVGRHSAPEPLKPAWRSVGSAGHVGQEDPISSSGEARASHEWSAENLHCGRAQSRSR